MDINVEKLNVTKSSSSTDVIVTVQIVLSAEQVSDFLTDAFEAQPEQWILSAEQTLGTVRPDKALVWWGQPDTITSELVFQVKYVDLSTNLVAEKTVTYDDLIKAFTILAKNYPSTFSNLVEGNYDAIDTYSFMQCVIYGDVLYG